MGIAAAGSLAGLLAAGAGMFVAGGVVKGTLGVGLPLVVVPLLSLMLPPNQAMGLLVLPVLLSNAMQAAEGGRLAYALRRFAPLMLAQLVATLVANHFSRQMSEQALNAAIAFTVMTAVGLMMVRPAGEVSARTERWAGPVVGALAGAMAGVSSRGEALRTRSERATRSIRSWIAGSGAPSSRVQRWPSNQNET